MNTIHEREEDFETSESLMGRLIQDLRMLCRVAGVPESLIKNPGQIRVGHRMTQEDAEWARKALTGFKAKQEGEREVIHTASIDVAHLIHEDK